MMIGSLAMMLIALPDRHDDPLRLADDADDPIVLNADQATWFDDDRFIHD
jgi:hypothetical protein